MLCTAEPDTLRAEGESLCGVLRCIGICADLKRTAFIRPCHEAAEIAGYRCLDCRNLTEVDITGCAVDRNIIAFADYVAVYFKIFFIFMHGYRAASRDAATSHTACDDCGMACPSSADGENALGGYHAFDILRRGFKSDKDDSAFSYGIALYILRSEVYHSGCGAGGSRKPCCGGGSVSESCWVKLRVKECVKLFRVDAHYRFVRCDRTFVHEVNRYFQCGGGSALAASGLKHIKPFVFDGEFHVLHIAVMVFELFRDICKLCVYLRHYFTERGDGFGSANAGNDILALCVHEKFAVQLLFSGRGVAREGNARTARFAHVAEYH